jgi:hypothetical protein
MFETAIYTLRLDDETSREGPSGHLTDAQRLSLFETVWENIPYKMLDKLVEEIKQDANQRH